jgi:hypothetical protein
MYVAELSDGDQPSVVWWAWITMKTWIFQGNPATFDIDGYLYASTGIITWRVARYADQMAVGDAVYVWRSQASEAGNAGVIAEGTIVESPAVQPDDGFASDIWAVTGFVVSH